MPFKSKAQIRKFGAMEKRREIPKGTIRRWTEDTPSIKQLPERLPRITNTARRKR